jgi:hypothetical protein
MTHTMLTKTEAELLTARAVTTANALAHLLKQLHDGQAHKALGYSTWSAYCAAHFDESLRTIQRYIRQERVCEAIAGSVNVSRFTNGALEALLDDDIDHMRQVADIAARSVTGDIGKDVVKSVQAAITETVNTGAVDINGEQYAVSDALVAGVRGTLREDVLKKRDYLIADIPAKYELYQLQGGFVRMIMLTSPIDNNARLNLSSANGDIVRISIWREHREQS